MVAVPSLTVPVSVSQYVEVPLVARICPADPVALFESRSSPVIRSLLMVEDARYESPVAEKFPVDVPLVNIRLVVEALVDEMLVEVLLVEVKSVKLPFVAAKLVV